MADGGAGSSCGHPTNTRPPPASPQDCVTQRNTIASFYKCDLYFQPTFEDTGNISLNIELNPKIVHKENPD